MPNTTSQTALRSFLYGGAATLLAFDLFFLAKSAVQQNFVPVVPIIAGILTAAGLLFIVHAEQRARLEDKREHRRISRVAHQLEAPLASLQEDMQKILAQAERLPAGERMRLKRMETKTKILLENIRDVFLMLQAQEGKLTQDVRTYDLCQLIEEALSRARPLASSHNVELTIKKHCPDAPIRVDRRLFFIVLAHLLENAILYTLTPGRVRVVVIKGNKAARVLVQDRGVGVKEADKAIIFQPFARGQAADQFDPDGIGVGLTLSRMIVREFKGELKWQPQGKSPGSQFEIRLPLAK